MAESKAFSVGAIFIGSLITIVSIIGFIIGDDYYLYYGAPIYGVCIVGVFMGIILVLAGIYDYFQADKREKEKYNKKPKVEEESIKILKSRYAKGEITKEEFEQMKKDLEWINIS